MPFYLKWWFIILCFLLTPATTGISFFVGIFLIYGRSKHKKTSQFDTMTNSNKLTSPPNNLNFVMDKSQENDYRILKESALIVEKTKIISTLISRSALIYDTAARMTKNEHSPDIRINDLLTELPNTINRRLKDLSVTAFEVKSKSAQFKRLCKMIEELKDCQLQNPEIQNVVDENLIYFKDLLSTHFPDVSYPFDIVKSIIPHPNKSTDLIKNTMPDIIPIRNNIAQHNPFFIIPDEIVKLLWFLDGQRKNISPTNRFSSAFTVDGYTFTISFQGAQEPSAISENLKIVIPKSFDAVPKLGYYPSYAELEPTQKWMYLNWLVDIQSKIDIGYVFIFYYGLERHLYFNNFEDAFKATLKLRKHHINNSFHNYSGSALIFSSMLHKRPDLFLEFYNTINLDKDPICSSPLYILCKKNLGFGLLPIEIINIASSFGFTNKRYIKNYPNIFEEELSKVLIENFNQAEFDLSSYLLMNCPETHECIAANYSLDQDQRFIKIPNLFEHRQLKKKASDILYTAHDNTKLRLKELRRKND